MRFLYPLLACCTFICFLFSEDLDSSNTPSQPSLTTLQSITYLPKKNHLEIQLHFKDPIYSEVSKDSKNEFVIPQVHPIKPIHKKLQDILDSIDISSQEDILTIKPKSQTPIYVNYSISEDQKQLTLNFTPILSPPGIHFEQYLLVLIVLVLCILILYFIRRFTYKKLTPQISFKKYFIEKQSFILELNVKNKRYYVLSTPRGQVLLGEEDSNIKIPYNKDPNTNFSSNLNQVLHLMQTSPIECTSKKSESSSINNSPLVLDGAEIQNIKKSLKEIDENFYAKNPQNSMQVENNYEKYQIGDFQKTIQKLPPHTKNLTKKMDLSLYFKKSRYKLKQLLRIFIKHERE